jgi:predicted TIM-barrel fold metal-dependent hydrolase
MEIWDAHVHLGTPYIDELRPDKGIIEKGACEKLIVDMDDNNIKGSLIFPTANVGREYEKSNDEVAACARSHPDRFIGFARVNPRLGSISVEEIRRATTKLGLNGLKLHPEIESFRPDHEAHRPIYELACELGLPLLIHTDPSTRAAIYSSPFYIERVAQKFPDLKIIMAHLNGDCLIVMERTPNLYAETSLSSIKTIKTAIEIGFEDKILFGTDYPYGNGHKFEIWKAKEATPEDRKREKLFNLNLKKLLK